MKTLSTAILLGLTIGLSNSASADAFNDRGENWIMTSITEGKETTQCPVDRTMAQSMGFKQKNQMELSNDNSSIRYNNQQLAAISTSRRSEQC